MLFARKIPCFLLFGGAIFTGRREIVATMASHVLIAYIPRQDPDRIAAFSDVLKEIFHDVAPQEYDIAAGTFSTKDAKSTTYTFLVIICQTKSLHQQILLNVMDEDPMPEPALLASAFTHALQEKWHKNAIVVATDVPGAEQYATFLFEAPESTGFNIFAH